MLDALSDESELLISVILALEVGIQRPDVRGVKRLLRPKTWAAGFL
jgi:hypothetical protein